MRKRGYVILCGLVLSLGAAPALTLADWGEGGPGRHHGGPGGPGMHMMGGGPGMPLHMILRKLNLSSDQQQAIDKIMADHRKNFQDDFQALRDSKKSFDAKFFSDSPAADIDPTDLQQKHDALMAEGSKTALEIRQYLIDQGLWPQAVQVWKQMETMRKEMHDFFGEKP